MKTDMILDAMNEINDEFLIISEKKRRRFSPKPLIIAATIALIFTITTPILAAENEMVYNIMYALSPEIAQKMKPVRMQDENNGIVMEVISADIRDSEAEIYIGLTDIEGDRISGDIDLLDSYVIRTPTSTGNNCRMIGYDETSKTATFLIRTKAMGENGKLAIGNKVTFSLRQFLGKSERIEDVTIQYDSSIIEANPKNEKNIDLVGVGIGKPDIRADIDTLETKEYLTPFDQPVAEISDIISVSAMGYVDNKLHVQLFLKDVIVSNYPNTVSFENQNGNEIPYDYMVMYHDENKTGSFFEFIFDMPAEKLKEYSLIGNFWISDDNDIVEGPWQVTFPLEKE